MLLDIKKSISKWLGEARRESTLLGVLPVDVEDGIILAGIALVVSSKGDILVVDLGAGVGYSSLWIASGLEAGCTSRCRLVLVERRKDRIEKAREILEKHQWRIDIEFHRVDALEYLESIPSSSIDMAFVDIEKKYYPEVLELLQQKLVEKGVALFHNAYTPRPPSEFYEKLEKSDSWRASILPTPQGLLVAYLEKR